MKTNLFIPMLGLQIFAEGAGDGGTAAGTGANGEAAAPQTTGVKGNPLAGVKYGIQEESVPAAGVAQAETPPDRKADFEKLIKGEYKSEFDARIQDILQRRLKSSREMESRLASQQTLIDMLAMKYGIQDAGDLTALTKAIEEDDSFFEDEAMKRGLTVQQYKQIRTMEKENADLRQQMQEKEQRENANKLYASWMNQAEELKKVYPSFNIRTEMENGQFLSLLRSGIDLRTAYEVLHKDEIIPAAMQFTAKTVEQKIAASVASGRSRPTENGNASQGAATVKSDVSKLSRADRDEIRRRVARGEKIRF